MPEEDETKQAPANRISPELDQTHPYMNLSPELAESSVTLFNFRSSRAHNDLDQQTIHSGSSDIETGTINSGSSSSTAGSNLSIVSKLSAHSADREGGPSQIKLARRIPKQTLIRAGEKDPLILGMSYNSALYELFLADYENRVVRAMRVRDNAGDLRDVYRAPHDTYSKIYSVCHMSDSDTLLVCSGEDGPDRKYAFWLVALSRNGSELREAQRVQTD